MHAHTQDRSVRLWLLRSQKGKYTKSARMCARPELFAAMHHPGGLVVKEARSEGDNDVEGGVTGRDVAAVYCLTAHHKR